MPRLLEEVITGRGTSRAGAALRAALTPISWIYAAGVGVRNILYDLGLRRAQRIGVPVISVGNLTVGGTGKTPLVMAVLERLLGKGRRPAILARSYGSSENELNDELTMVKKRFPGVLICPGADRVAAGRLAVGQGADIVVLDDGFQHRRLYRDLDILTVDATLAARHPFLIPAGPYREPWRNRRRADVVVLTKCGTDVPPQSAGSGAVMTSHAPSHLAWNEMRREIAYLEGRRAFLACGIADPASFEATAASLGVKPAGVRRFADHHNFTRADAKALRDAARAADAPLVLTTEKDMVKLSRYEETAENDVEFLALCITIHVLSNGGALWEPIDELCT